MKRTERVPTGPSSEPPSLPVGDSTVIMLLALFVIFVISVPKYDIPGVIAFAAFPLLLITATRIPFRPMLKRLGLASPFILFMAAGNLFFDRTPAADLGGFTATGGMVSAAVITMKAAVTLSALLSLMALMPFHRFGAALGSLGVPEVFVTQLLLVYRYSFLLADEAGMIQKARDLRSFGGRGKGPIVTARLLGSLLIRTTSRAERIYNAMSARGFGSALHSKPHTRPGCKEIAALFIALVLFIALRSIF
jgi:cobalt/nickel transport system permease protein